MACYTSRTLTVPTLWGMYRDPYEASYPSQVGTYYLPTYNR